MRIALNLISLAHPEWFLLLLLIPPALAAAWLRARSRSLFLRGLGWSGPSLSWADLSGVCSAVFLILTLAGFGWAWPNRRTGESRDLVLVLDVSRSMAAEDAVPDRMTVAKKAALSLLDELIKQPGTRVGLVAFASRAVVRSPLTENLGAVRRALERLEPGTVQPGGSNLGAGLETALKLLDAGSQEPGGSLLVLSDGEDHEQSWPAVLGLAQHDRVLIHTIAIGAPDVGSTIPGGSRSTRQGQDTQATVPLTYQGEVVKTRRQDESLERIALLTGGRFLAMGRTAMNLGPTDQAVYLPAARQVELQRTQQRQSEYLPWSALVALLCLAVLPILKRFSVPVPRWLGAASLILVCVAAGRPDDPGLKAYRAGRWNEAERYYEHRPEFAQGDPVLIFNRGVCAYQLGRYEDSAALFSRAEKGSAGLLRLKTRYARGNSLIGLGLVNEAAAIYQLCEADSTAGPEADAIREDARTNHEYLVQLRNQQDQAEASQKAQAGGDLSAGQKGQELPEPGSSPASQQKTPGEGGTSASSQPASTGTKGDPSRRPTQSNSVNSSSIQESVRERWRSAVNDVDRRRNQGAQTLEKLPAQLETPDW